MFVCERILHPHTKLHTEIKKEGRNCEWCWWVWCVFSMGIGNVENDLYMMNMMMWSYHNECFSLYGSRCMLYSHTHIIWLCNSLFCSILWHIVIVVLSIIIYSYYLRYYHKTSFQFRVFPHNAYHIIHDGHRLEPTTH